MASAASAALALLLVALPAASATDAAPAARYTTRDDDLRSFFTALGARLGQTVVVSPLAARKRIGGSFDLGNPQQVLRTVGTELGLVWWSDGRTLHIWDASELRSAVLAMDRASVATLIAQLQRTGLYDPRYPLRGDPRGGSFAITAPPLYLDLVTRSAELLDRPRGGLDAAGQQIDVIPLRHAQAADRSYTMRGQTVTIPGMASVLQRALDTPPRLPASTASGATAAASTSATVLADPDRNSLLVRGAPELIARVRALVQQMDQAKRHIELSLWIVDISASDLEQLGVLWNGDRRAGALQATLDGERFVASVKALASRGEASIVSRPILLTQDNVPALFDDSHTVYTRLVGERAVSLESITYGTLVRVLPRFDADNQIEMELTIEDGSQVARAAGADDALPEVGRIHISTVARVPQGRSLLIGGYTRDQRSRSRAGLPLLSRLPLLGLLFGQRQQSRHNSVRVFLIQPRAPDLDAGAGNGRDHAH